MTTFLLTMIVLGMLSFVGYRINMYLYTQGAVRVGARTLQSIVVDMPMQPVYEAGLKEQDYGLRYARTGILLIAAFLVLIVAGMLIVLFGVL